MFGDDNLGKNGYSLISTYVTITKHVLCHNNLNILSVTGVEGQIKQINQEFCRGNQHHSVLYMAHCYVQLQYSLAKGYICIFGAVS